MCYFPLDGRGDMDNEVLYIVEMSSSLEPDVAWEVLQEALERCRLTAAWYESDDDRHELHQAQNGQQALALQ